MSDTIFQNLREDHDVQRSILDKLAKTSGDGSLRGDLYQVLKIELKDHAKYEEQHFYTPLMVDDLTQDKARHSVAEHKDIDDQLEDLDNTEFSSTAWLTKLKKLKDCVEHHLDEEEQEVFPLAGRALTKTEKVESARDYKKDMREHHRSP